MQRVNRNPVLEADVLILGGGIAGLWLLQRLLHAGYAAVLVEQDRLGGGQTGAAQGIIHGGVKYALDGQLTDASEAIADMPRRWRACLEGQGEVDLRRVQVLAEGFHLWSVEQPGGALGQLLGSPALRDRVTPLRCEDQPPCFRHEAFHGSVYRLDEVVLDPASLVATLAAPHAPHIIRVNNVAGSLRHDGGDFRLPTGGPTLQARQIILAAGAGNAELLAALGRTEPDMQRRPLQQVAVELRHPHAVNGHCVTASSIHGPVLTVTSHPLGQDHWLLYLGGQLAETGSGHSSAVQIEAAQALITEVLPWLLPHLTAWRSLRIDRAEPAAADASRPAKAFVHAAAGVITVWPTKLALVPDLADQVLPLLSPPQAPGRRRSDRLVAQLSDLPRPQTTRGLAEYLG